jgi:dipeptidyl aminopeptidase/acylaminoacyl peptidase
MSERDGWRHLYLYDAETGSVKNQITDGDWVVREVDYVDEDNRQIWFQASGMDDDQDPYYSHYFRVNFDGSGLTRFTEANGDHDVTFSSDREFYVDTWSQVDKAPVSKLRRTSDQSLVMTLEEGDISNLIDAGWQAPEQFSAKGRDGETDIYGIIVRPTDFDSDKSYPVIEYIYAGPHSNFVPKSFMPYSQMMRLAELGFIVVQIDGMGTANRSKAFHDVAWQNLKDAGFPDRILWHEAVAEEYDWYDNSKVGIYGRSAGGQSSLGALLFHPEFYHVAVSSVGCHDNRMDKIWWNEQWMGWPIGPQYAASSNVEHAHNLQGNVLLVVGELDTNVDPASTYQVADALIKANKDFDFITVPGAGHGSVGRYEERKRFDYFVEHLQGGSTPSWNQMADSEADTE